MPFHSRLGRQLLACFVSVTCSVTAFGQAMSLPQLQPPANKTAAKPCSFIELDQLKDSLSAEQARVSQVVDRLTAAKAALERAQHDLDDSQRKVRQAQGVETNNDSSKAADVAADLEQAKQS